MMKTIGRDLPGGDYMEIEAEERDGSEGLSPGFAITASVWMKHATWDGRARKRNGRDIDMGGCMHDEILDIAPELAPLVTAHLADPEGVPMHAVANGWYFYTGASREYELKNYGQAYVDRLGTDRERAAQALSIPVEDLPEGMDRGAFVDFAQTLVERWEQQAAEARAVLEAMIDGDGVEEA